MAHAYCPKCGHDINGSAGTCPACGRPLDPPDLPETEAPTQQWSSSEQLPSAKLPQDLLDWARRHFNEEEFIEGLRDIQQTGGVELRDFIQELEQEAAPRG